MKFTKMQGLGNDYIYVNCFTESVKNPNALAKKISDRHFGVGSDGLVLILPSKTADFKMSMYNADGSEGLMCGNAIRSVGKYVYEKNMTDKTRLSIETLSGIKQLELKVNKGEVCAVRVNMHNPIISPALIPMRAAGDSFINREVTVNGREYRATALSMGNPHWVFFTDDIESLDLKHTGKFFENHELFPERVNTEFCRIEKDTIYMRVWERGTGETMACGTGACASLVAAVLNNKCGRTAIVKLAGGELLIEWDEKDNNVYMTGPAEFVFEGTYQFKE